MTLLFYAQPYDISAEGFYFKSIDEYDSKAKDHKNDYGDPVEEYEIQFIDGEDIDCKFAKIWQVNQANLATFFEAVDALEVWQKTHYIILVGECGYSHQQVMDDPETADLTIYDASTLRELAEQFVDEGLYGEIPQSLQNYIDYDAIARDLGMDYAETEIAGQHLIYRCD